MNVILIFWIIAVELGLSNGQIEHEVCTTVDKCPTAARQDRFYLASKQCGTEGRNIKVWCKIPCVTPEYKNGVCTPWNLCDSFNTLASRLSLPNPGEITPEARNYLRRFECSMPTKTSEVHVCCTEETNYVVRTKSTSTATEKYANEEYCGIQNDLFKVVGGTEAQLGQFPWLALLQYTRKEELSFKCGGALINRKYVLTAAHCLDGYKGTLVNVYLGEHNVASKQDCFQGQCSVAQIIPVEDTIQHPGWVYAAHRFADDLALVRLSRNANYDFFVQPICLPSKDFLPKPNEYLTVAGWGQNEISAFSNIKLYAKIPIRRKSSCFNTIKIDLVEGQICAGGESADSCKGDSGGPLMKNKVEDGREIWSVIGVVSFGYNSPCGTLGRPGIYTYVPHYVDWIKENSKY